MKKLAFAAALLGLAALISPAAHALQATGTFQVQINLTTSCALTQPSGPVTFDYTSLQSGPQGLNTDGSFSVRCTENLPYTVSLDRAAGDSGTGTTYSYTDSATNLNYTLTLSAPGATGTGNAQGFTISGQMAGNQGGRCATAPAQNTAAGAATICDNSSSGAQRVRTITLVY